MNLHQLLVDTFIDFEYLKGSNMQSTRSFLGGYIASSFKQIFGRAIDFQELETINAAIDKFVSGNNNAKS